MRRASIIQKMTAIVAILVIFAGTQGFVISSHTCNSCGTHDATVSLFGGISAENHNCQTEHAGSGSQTPARQAETHKSCCPTDAPLAETQGSCCSKPATLPATHGSTGSTSSCETIGGGVCCEYEIERVVVETFSPEKSARIAVLIQPLMAAATYTVAVMPEPRRINFDLHNKHGGGRDIVLLTCCLLI